MADTEATPAPTGLAKLAAANKAAAAKTPNHVARQAKLPQVRQSAVDWKNLITPAINLTRSSLMQTCLYAIGGHCKTSLGTTIPEEWGEILYICADPTSAQLDSILPDIHNRVHTYEVGKFDTYLKEFQELARMNPKTAYDNAVGVTVFDTVSTFCELMLAENANQNWFTENKPIAGSALDPDRIARPTKGDFGQVQDNVRQILKTWLRNQTTHLIFLFQEVTSDEGLVGPATVGNKSPKQIPQLFSNVIRLNRTKDRRNPHGKLLAWTEPETVGAITIVAGAKGWKPLGTNGVYEIGPTMQDMQRFWLDLESIHKKEMSQ